MGLTEDGFVAGEQTHHEVGLRELTSKDVIDAQFAAEKVVVIDGNAMAYTSDALMGVELLRRQVEFVGSYQGPLSLKELYRFSPADLDGLRKKAEEIDQLLAKEIAARGRN